MLFSKIQYKIQWSSIFFSSLRPVYFQSTSSLLPVYFQSSSNLLPIYFQSTSSLIPVYLQSTSSLFPFYLQSDSSLLPVYFQSTSSLLPVYFQSSYILCQCPFKYLSNPRKSTSSFRLDVNKSASISFPVFLDLFSMLGHMKKSCKIKKKFISVIFLFFL